MAGADLASGGSLPRRPRVWGGQRAEPAPLIQRGRLYQAELALLRPFRLVQRWHLGNDMLSFYRRG